MICYIIHEQVIVVLLLLVYLAGFISVRKTSMAEEGDINIIFQSNSSGFENKEPYINKTILMVIDALRSDHVVTSAYPRMPYLDSLLKHNHAKGYVMQTATPTVTLPRIKSLVTGSIPGFLDVMANFGAGELKDDNLLQRWKTAGRRLQFYGDDTWLRLFPLVFEQYEGVTSFFVADYTEVDQNVTRHLKEALTRLKTWDVLVLHFLGLDHIGHLEGPGSDLVGPKLLQMDLVVEEIHRTMELSAERYMMLICGDHGMGDAGGHGGASASEITTSAIFVTNSQLMSQLSTMNKKTEIYQTQVAPTLALLTGISIPSGTVAQPVTELLALVPLWQRLEFHRAATRQLLAVGEGIESGADHGDAVSLFKEALRLHSDFFHDIDSTQQQTFLGHRIQALYVDSQTLFADSIRHASGSYDLPAIFAVTLVLALITITSFLNLIEKVTYRLVLKDYIHIALATLLLHFVMFYLVPHSRASQAQHPTAWVLWYVSFVLCTRALTLYRGIETGSLKKAVFEQHSEGTSSALKNFILFGSVFHALSLFGSSCVEEEHQTAYFMLTSAHAVILCGVCLSGNGMMGKSMWGKEQLNFCRNESTELIHEGIFGQTMKQIINFCEICCRSQQKIVGKTKQRIQVKRTHETIMTILLIMASVFLLRLGRSWNSAGDKWRHLTDLADVLQSATPVWQGVACGVSLSFALALFRQRLSGFGWLLAAVVCGCVLLRHFPIYGEGVAMGVPEAQCAYVLLGCMVLYGVFRVIFCDGDISVPDRVAYDALFARYAQLPVGYEASVGCETDHHCYEVPDRVGIFPDILPRITSCNYSSVNLLQLTMNYIVTVLALLIFVLQRLENLPLLVLVLVQSHVFVCLLLHLLERGYCCVTTSALAVHWLAYAQFFLQGNSNSLSTVDVSAGFIGVTSYLPFVHGILITMHTFGTMMLTYFIYLEATCRLGFETQCRSICAWWLIRLITVSVYLVNVTFQRNHLFIWTVFTPKLLYEGAHVLVLLTVTILTGVLRLGCGISTFRT